MRFDKSLIATSEELKGKNFHEKSNQWLKRYKKITNDEFYYLQGRLQESKGDIFKDINKNRFTLAGSRDNYYLWRVKW
jgi:hypothetical protein